MEFGSAQIALTAYLYKSKFRAERRLNGYLVESLAFFVQRRDGPDTIESIRSVVDRFLVEDDLVELDLVFIVTYECPGCHLLLEDRSKGVPAWHRCPRCDRPSLPPDHQNWNRPAFQSVTKPIIDTGTFFIEDEGPVRPRLMAPMPSASGQGTSSLFLGLGVGFFASIFLCIVSLLNKSQPLAWITGLSAATCFVLLIVPNGRSPRG